MVNLERAGINGRVRTDPAPSWYWATRGLGSKINGRDLVTDLSERETDVLRLIALGHTNAEIAEKLFISVRTVETHRAHIQQKLGVSSRAELVRCALSRGLVEI
jgi:DNA-binding NarL/FixJ family response regulator